MVTYILIGLLVGFVLKFLFRASGEKGYNDLTINDLNGLRKNRDTVLVDVRTPKETRQGMIGKPKEIQLGPGMDQAFSTLDKDKKYIVYCRSGQRSVYASKKMVKMGFTDVNNLQGGYLAWQRNK